MLSVGAIDAKALRAAFDDGCELAVIDVREEGVFGQRHILRCNNIPLSVLELSIRDLVPRLETRVVLVDAKDGLVERATTTLSRDVITFLLCTSHANHSASFDFCYLPHHSTNCPRGC